MNCGTQFVETLKRTGYSKAASLNGEDFDWLFETLEDNSFLGWFCTNLNEYHVLSEKELQLFNGLLKSAKPVLEEVALDEILKTCKPFDLNTGNDEEDKLKTLEDEFQALQKIKQLKIQRLNKLQMTASTNSIMSVKLKEVGGETAKRLNETQRMFTAVNTKLNNKFQSLTEKAKKLTSFFTVERRQRLDPQPVLLVQLALDKYLDQEEQGTAALTSYTKKQFFQGISELVESSNEENFQLVDIRKSSVSGESSGACEGMRELNRLQMAYVCAQHQLIQQKARDFSMQSSLRWAEENVCAFKMKIPGKEKFEARISTLNDEISKIKKHLVQINKETVPLLVKEDAELLNMPVVKGDFDLQIARQDYYTSRQDQICNQLISQKASFELLQLVFEIEFRKLRDNSRLLENMVQDLKRSSNASEQILETASEPSISQHKISRSIIDSKDKAMHRLYQLLEGKTPKELLRTYEGLEQMAVKLNIDTVSELDQLGEASQEQILLLSKMDADLAALRESMYCRGGIVCLSNQELTEEFQQLEFYLNKLNQLITDFLADIKTKKMILDSNKLQQKERELYVYFFQDEEHLKNVVLRTEQQAKV